MEPSDTWSRAEEVFNAALALPKAERPALIEERCAGQPAVRDEVLNLLKARSAMGSEFLQAPALDFRGQTFGAYRAVREIGRGGMSVVYAGERIEGGFEKTVAIKVVLLQSPSPPAADIVSRKQHETQILAGLEHPNIARLLDAGTTDLGFPYLVMEFVEGRPITEYSQGLSEERKLRLFLDICSAVQNAHRSLVVHRDLKPDNILVTADGVVKLLDFGIAKMLSAAGAGQAAAQATTGIRAFTADYASPEQILAQPVTTSSDVYSLGVLLCELAGGRVPRRLARLDMAELVETAQNREVTGVPLQGDLAVIARKALCRNPRERYESASALGRDVERYLSGLPVEARTPSWSYNAAKFVRRNRYPVAAGVLALVAAVAGVIAVSWQAHVAHRERLRSDARFGQVRKLANEFIGQSQTGLRSVPGTLHYRRQMTDAGLRYLDALAEDAATDPGLSLELAQGYIQLGQVLGSPSLPNLGNRPAAASSFQKAIRLARNVLDRSPRDLAAADAFAIAASYGNDLALAERRFDDILALSAEVERRLNGVPIPPGSGRRMSDALRRLHRRVVEVERTPDDDPVPHWRAAAAAALEQSEAAQLLPRRLAELFLLAKLPARAEAYARRTMEAWNSGLPAPPGTVAVASHHTALARGLLGLALADQGKLHQGRDELEGEARTLAQLSAAEPADSQYKADLAETEMNLGLVSLKLGDSVAARQWFERAAGRSLALTGQPASVLPRTIFVRGRSLLEQANLTASGERRCSLIGEAAAWLEANERKGVTLRRERPWLMQTRDALRSCR